MKTKFKIIGLALVLVTVIWAYTKYRRNGVQKDIKTIPSKLFFARIIIRLEHWWFIFLYIFLYWRTLLIPQHGDLAPSSEYKKRSVRDWTRNTVTITETSCCTKGRNFIILRWVCMVVANLRICIKNDISRSRVRKRPMVFLQKIWYKASTSSIRMV